MNARFVAWDTVGLLRLSRARVAVHIVDLAARTTTSLQHTGVLSTPAKPLDGEGGAGTSYNKRRIAPVQVQQGKQSKGAKMLRRAVGK